MTEKIHNLSFIMRNGREIPQVPVNLCWTDRLGTIMVRTGIRRMHYLVEPGLYAVCNPDEDSPVLVSANYKLSFDALRKELNSLDAWIMLLNTKGINVWCAAGKGTFGTDEIIRRIDLVELKKIVNHRKVILPQLGAVGVAAHEVKKRSDFSVIYGPVRACDLAAFIKADMKATEQMRQIKFSLYDRLILTPVELVTGFKYLALIIAVFFILSGINAKGYSSELLMKDGIRSALNLFAAYLGGSVIAPMLLPWLPGRSFSFKGFSVGLTIALLFLFLELTGGIFETIGWMFLITVLASFTTMNFTGASTYTSLSGVRKEMNVAVPLQLVAAIIGTGMWIVSRFA